MKDVEEPKWYLSALISQFDLRNMEAWSMSAKLYLKHLIEEVELKWGTSAQCLKVTFGHTGYNMVSPQTISD